MSADDPTRRFYAENAATYAARQRQPPSEMLEAFLAELPAGGVILELGCGGGQDAEHLLGRGFDVRPTDGSAELAAIATLRLGRPVKVMLFDDLDETEAFDGVWASASLLHAPSASLAGILARVHRALRPGGCFWASYKGGTGEGRDRFGRYYNYPGETELLDHYRQAAPWRSLDITNATGTGYDDVVTDWLWVRARR